MTVKELKLVTEYGMPVDVAHICDCDPTTIEPKYFYFHNGEDVYIDEKCGKRIREEDKLAYDIHMGVNGFDEDNMGDNYMDFLMECGDE